MKKKKFIAMISVSVIGLSFTPVVSDLTSQQHVIYAISKEYDNALELGKMIKDTNLSKKEYYDTLQKESEFEKKAVDYTVKKLKINWKKNCLKKAKQLQDFGLSKEKIKKSLLSSDDGGKFTKSEVNYAMKHLEDNQK